MILLKILGFIHCLPNTICCVPVVLVLWALKQIQKMDVSIYGVENLAFCLPFGVVEDSWLEKNTKYLGLTCGAFLFFRKSSDLSLAKLQRIIIHERQHVLQQYWFGLLQPVLYVLFCAVIWVTMPEKHSYYDNPFEKDARRAAGQDVDIPREKWKDPNDRWYWWVWLLALIPMAKVALTAGAA